MAAWAAHHFPGADPRRVVAVVAHCRSRLAGNSADVTAAVVREFADHNPMWAIYPKET